MIKTLKICCNVRLLEVFALKKAARLRAFFNFIWTNVPYLMSLACFATYIFLDPNNELDAQKAFVTMTYINLIKLPMMFIPFLLIGAIQVSVAIQRLNRYMNSEELDDAAVNRDTNDSTDLPGKRFKIRTVLCLYH